MKRLVLGVAIPVMAPAALASSNLDSSIYVAAEFTHTDFGISKSDFPAMSVGGTTFAPTDVDSRDSGTHFLVGLRPHRNFSFDVGRIDFGDASVTYQPFSIESEVSVDGLALGANALFPLHNQVTLFARVGMLDWDLDVEGSAAGTTLVTGSDDGSDPFMGAGFLFGWDALKFRGSFTRYEIDGDDLDTFSAGLQYFFAI
ncbi:MAG TPA: hypothetical protein DHW52_10045 [Alcanivorax sp.]|nr:hypothetical protein [Alcanivorax sp.]